MKILNEFVPTRKFLKLAEEIKDLVDGWNVTDSAAGFPAPSGTVVSCVLKSKYPEKEIVPIFILHYTGPVEVIAIGLAPGELLLESVVAAVKEHDIQNGVVVSGIATLKVAHMHHITHDHFPPDDRFFTIAKPLEVSNISGIIADGQPHLHMTVGYRDEWAVAGHLEPGCEVLYLAEVVILKFNGMALQRHLDTERRIKLLGSKI